VLRPPNAGDVPAIVDGCSDPDVTRFMPVLPIPYSEDDARAWLDGAEERWKTDRERAFAITIPPSDELMGVISIELRPGGVTGYWLRAQARGRGLMTEALVAVAEWADVRGLHLNAHEDNVGSQRVAEKAGFARVGLVPHDPPFHDGRADAVRYQR
jgi:RimJ/RimL family protein N-acetyltransferase